ncbi:MAG TPA: hypothetical protein PL076_09295 [Bacillota bacterium]|jgi:L-cystine uptake protein TcyP (sodium:dicarboxylate symporter family)|nr:hypothetical protein [Bacillota bacterium]HQE66016.1 hypothetical protein [Bacillota bacterium]HQI16305.1 hypothetical protein [Bacillota bacterium]HQJ38013.1 hypothetical protein [Bacillota bacterium]
MNISETLVVPIIVSLTQLAKELGLPKKFCALAAVVIGVIIGVFFLEPQCIKTGVFKGIVYGLSASGLYSGTKNTIEQVNGKNVKKKKK